MSLNVNVAPLPPFDIASHSRILGVVFLVFGVAHIIVVGFLLAVFLFLVIMPFGNPNEDQFNLIFVIILSIVFLIVGVLPVVAGFGLVSTKRWGTKAIAFSSAMMVLFIGSVTFFPIWRWKQYAMVLYVLPCLILMFYSGWYLSLGGRRLTNAWSGLAIERPLFVVAWASRSSVTLDASCFASKDD